MPTLAQIAQDAAVDRSDEPLVVLPSSPQAQHKRPWWRQGHIAVGGNPFASVGLMWCPRCKDETDTDTQAECGQGVYVYKRACCRCGLVVQYGVCQVHMLSDRPLPEAAFAWVFTPGQDRR